MRLHTPKFTALIWRTRTQERHVGTLMRMLSNHANAEHCYSRMQGSPTVFISGLQSSAVLTPETGPCIAAPSTNSETMPGQTPPNLNGSFTTSLTRTLLARLLSVHLAPGPKMRNA
eukprot:1448409-Amphidinium_carterae.1